MMSILEKIEKAFAERMTEGILPDLLIINHKDERSLFTDGFIPKASSAEKFFMDKYKVELFVISTKLTTEPEFYGRYLVNSTTA
jgi:hypothetical protein